MSQKQKRPSFTRRVLEKIDAPNDKLMDWVFENPGKRWWVGLAFVAGLILVLALLILVAAALAGTTGSSIVSIPTSSGESPSGIWGTLVIVGVIGFAGILIAYQILNRRDRDEDASDEDSSS